MAPSEYHVTSHWSVFGTSEEVFDILNAPEDLPRWWPAAFTDSLPIQTGDETGKARVVRLEGQGALPFRLRWHVHTKDVERPHRLINEVWGDLQGTGSWTITQADEHTTVDSDWRIHVRKPLSGALMPLLKPLLIAGHRSAMAKGEQSLQIELDRLHAAEASGLSLVQQPPGPAAMPKSLVPFAFGAAVAMITARQKHLTKARENAAKA